MSRGLEARIEKLEQKMGKAEKLIVVLVAFGKSDHRAELTGYESGGNGWPITTTTRNPGESDDDLAARAELSAPRSGAVIVLRELRNATP